MVMVPVAPVPPAASVATPPCPAVVALAVVATRPATLSAARESVVAAVVTPWPVNVNVPLAAVASAVTVTPEALLIAVASEVASVAKTVVATV